MFDRSLMAVGFMSTVIEESSSVLAI